MTNDRTYWRMMPTSELIVVAAERYATDLELVLLERLEVLADIAVELEAAQTAIEELQTEKAEQEAEIAELQAQLDATVDA
jgi:septal ring factor EnvC (AmiA/AmiB activator)